MIILLIISLVLNIILLFFLLSRADINVRNSNGNAETEIKIAGPSLDSAGIASNAVMDTNLDAFRTWFDGLQDRSMIGDMFLKKIAADIEAVHGVLYVHEEKENKQVYRFKNGYAFSCPESKPIEFELGESLIGQVAKDKKILNLNETPIEHNQVISGLGKTTSQFLIICPLLKNEQTIAVLEFSSFKPIDKKTEQYIFAAANLITEESHW